MKNRFIARVLISAALIGPFALLAQDRLFISEISDPADDYTGRFIELYNSGNGDINFDEALYFLSRQSNGGTTWGELQLSGVVASGDTYIIGTSSFSSHYGFEPDLVTGILTGNGDDAYVLFRGGDHGSGMAHDVYGEINVDGTGLPWEYTDSRAVRNSDILFPSDTWVSGEWTISGSTIAQGTPGFHSVSGDPGPDPGPYSFLIADDTVDLGASFSLAVEVIELAISDSIIAFQFDLEYDTVSLSFRGASLEGTLGEEGNLAVNAATPGKISLAYMNATPLSGSGALVLLEFESLELDTTELFLSNAYLNTMAMADNFSTTILIRENSPPKGTVTFADSDARYGDSVLITAEFNEPMSLDHSVEIWFEGLSGYLPKPMNRINDTLYVLHWEVPMAEGWIYPRLGGGMDLYGNPVDPIPLNNDSIFIFPFAHGDVDDDGEILAYDAALVLQYSVGIDPIPEVDPMPWEVWRGRTADVNNDGMITAYDAGLILQVAVGLPGFTGNMQVEPVDISVEIEQDHLVFYQQGELVGMNIFLLGALDRLGEPEIMVEEYLMAFHGNEDDLKIGICSAGSPSERFPLMRIPYDGEGPVRVEMTVNTEKQLLLVENPVLLQSIESGEIALYPNPTGDILSIQGSKGFYEIKLLDVFGRVLGTWNEYTRQTSLDVSFLTGGIYTLIVRSGDQLVVKRFIKH